MKVIESSQNFQVWNLRQSGRNWSNQLIVFQNSERLQTLDYDAVSIIGKKLEI